MAAMVVRTGSVCHGDQIVQERIGAELTSQATVGRDILNTSIKSRENLLKMLIRDVRDA